MVYKSNCLFDDYYTNDHRSYKAHKLFTCREKAETFVRDSNRNEIERIFKNEEFSQHIEGYSLRSIGLTRMIELLRKHGMYIVDNELKCELPLTYEAVDALFANPNLIAPYKVEILQVL